MTVGSFTWHGLQEELASRRDSKARSEQYTATKQKPEYDACARLPLFHQEDCFTEENEAGRANQRSECDLVAQETTAVWTFITSIAALFGVALSFLGVGLVWGTFRESRKTNEITREIGQAQVRAYLSLTVADIKITETMNDGKRSLRVNILVRMENKGQSPAENARVPFNIATVGAIETVSMMANGSDFFEPPTPVHSIEAGGHVMNNLSREFLSDVTDVLDSGHRLRFSYVIRYTDVFGEDRRTSVVSGTIARLAPDSEKLRLLADVIARCLVPAFDGVG